MRRRLDRGRAARPAGAAPRGAGPHRGARMNMLAESARAMLEGIDISDAQPRHVGKLVAYDGLMLEATGFVRPIGSGARIIAGDCSAARAGVVGFRVDRTLLVAIASDAPHPSGPPGEPVSGRSAAVGGTARVGDRAAVVVG